MANWGFHELRGPVVYKAALAGVAVVFVDPRNTSRGSSCCGLIDQTGPAGTNSSVSVAGLLPPPTIVRRLTYTGRSSSPTASSSGFMFLRDQLVGPGSDRLTQVPVRALLHMICCRHWPGSTAHLAKTHRDRDLQEHLPTLELDGAIATISMPSFCLRSTSCQAPR
jgi:Putative transposase DNA-binding domain